MKLDNDRTACTSAEEDEAVPRPNIAEASSLAAPVDDDDDLLQDVIERQHGAFTPSKSILKHSMIFITEVDGGGRPLPPRFTDYSYLGLFVPSLDDSYHVEKGNIFYTV